MAIIDENLKNWTFPDIRAFYTGKDSILYALGLGIGCSPIEHDELCYVYERNQLVFPTMAVAVGNPLMWFSDPNTGIDHRYILHAEQSLTIHHPMTVSGEVISKNRVIEIIDKGQGRGAIITTERKLYHADGGELLATMVSSSFARADGGFGGPVVKSPAPHAIPSRDPDFTVEFGTLPQAALIYRLSGDDSAIHADPKIASEFGFARPILHGLCTFGIAARAIIAAFCKSNPYQLQEMTVRFSAPVYPGETIRTELWREDATISFRASVVERNVLVLNNGRARVNL